MSENLELVKCVICENDNYTRIHVFRYQDLKLNLVLCKNCGLGYLNPRWTKKQYLNYYRNCYDEQYRPDLKSKIGNLHSQEQNIIIERFKENKLMFNQAKSILDIGSGSGDNLLAFKEVNSKLDCYAIEPSKTSQDVLKVRNVTIISDDVDSDWDKNYIGKFDIIIMRHVLEHFLNPVKVLEKVHNVLSENGILYVAVPNNLVKNRNEGWLRIAHTYYFNQFTFTAILNKTAFKINCIFSKDKFNKLEVFAFAQKDKRLNKKNDIINENAYKIQKKIYSIVFREEELLNRIKVFVKKIRLKF